MANIDIRNYAAERNVKLWQVSEALGYGHETKFSRELRHELPEQKKQIILAIIDKIAGDVRE